MADIEIDKIPDSQTTESQTTMGGWKINSRELSLTPTNGNKNKESIELRPKVMQVLLSLVARQGHVVTREELINEVWEGNNFVGENGLTDAIWQLRKHLDEDKERAPYIQTIPKKGYRLLVANNEISSINWGRPARLITISAMLMIGCVLVLNELGFFQSGSDSRPTTHSTITQLKGNETYPEISPNGKYLTYTHIAPGSLYRIYLKDLEAENAAPRLLPVAQGLQSGFATWSDSNDKIAYIASDLANVCQIRTYDLISNKEKTLTECNIRYVSGFGWDDTTGLLTFSNKDEHSNAWVINLFDSKSNQHKQLTFPAENVQYIDRNPRFSPSGTRIAFSRQIGVGNADMYMTDLQGNIQRLTQWNTSIMGFSWAANDNELLVAVLENNKITLNHFAIDTQVKTAINLDGHSGAFPDYHHASQQLVFSKRSMVSSLVALDINPKPNTIRVKGLFQSPSTDTYPNYSAQAQQYAFISNRDGFDELWLANENDKFTKLTDLKTEIYSPSWSPDGGKIAFTAADSNNKFRQLFIVDIITKDIKQLTFDDTDHAPPTWSNEGDYLYSGVSKEGIFYLWRYDLEGNGQQHLDIPSIYALEHPENNTLWFTDMKEGGIFEYDIETKLAKKIIENNSRRDGSNWLTTKDGIYYVLRSDDQDAINFYDLATQSHRTIMQFPASTISAFQTIALNPKTQEIIFVQRFKQESDIHRVVNPLLPN